MTVVHDTTGRPRHPEKAHRPDAPLLRKPDWIRVKAPVSRGYLDTHAIVRGNRLHTVCEEAGCPNIGECWEKKHATFMIMGDTCTRACAFCNVKTGLPQALDPNEPESVANPPPWSQTMIGLRPPSFKPRVQTLRTRQSSAPDGDDAVPCAAVGP